MEEEQAEGMLEALKTIANVLDDIGLMTTLKNVREHTLFLFEIIPRLVALDIPEDLAKDFMDRAHVHWSESNEMLDDTIMSASGYIEFEPFLELYRVLVSKREKERK